MRPVAGPRTVAVALALAAVAFVLASELARRHAPRFDWTRAGRHSLSPRTEALLRALEPPVHAVLVSAAPAVATNEDERVAAELAPRLQSLLGAFARAAAGKLEVEVVDALRDPTRARSRLAEHGVRLPNVVLLRRGGVHRALGFARLRGGGAEGVLVSAIESLRREPLTILFARGHDEASLEDEGPAGLSRLAGRLRALGLEPRSIDGLRAIPAATRVVVLASPRRALSPEEEAALATHLARGGALVAFLPPLFVGAGARAAPAPTGIEGLLAAAGLRLGDGLLVDPRAAIAGASPGTFAARPSRAHAVARAVAEPVVVSGARPILGGEAVLRTSASARLRESPDAPPKGDARTFHVAASSTKTGRVIVVGEGSFAENERLDRAANERFVVAALDWALGDLDGEPKAAAEKAALVLDRRAARLAFWLFVLALPAAATTGGVLVALARRRRP